jgi:arginyl-tRNA synthetase
MRYRSWIADVIEARYSGEYVNEIAAELVRRYGRSLLDIPEEDAIRLIKDVVIDMMMGWIRRDLAAMDIRHDVFFSERTLHEIHSRGSFNAADDPDYQR